MKTSWKVLHYNERGEGELTSLVAHLSELDHLMIEPVHSFKDLKERLVASDIFCLIYSISTFQDLQSLQLKELASTAQLVPVLVHASDLDADAARTLISMRGVYRLLLSDDPKQFESLLQQACAEHLKRIESQQLMRDYIKQNRELEDLGRDLERLVFERTLTLEKSKTEVEERVSGLRDLVRFTENLSRAENLEDLLKSVHREIRLFPEVRPPLLCFVTHEARNKLLFFQGNQLIEKQIEGSLTVNKRIRANDRNDRQELAQALGRPLGQLLSLPMSQIAKDRRQATLFIEHSLTEAQHQVFLNRLLERLQPLSLAVDRLLLEYQLTSTSFLWAKTFDNVDEPLAIVDDQMNLIRSNRRFQKEQGEKCYQVFSRADEICYGCPLVQALENNSAHTGQVKRGDSLYEVSSFPIRSNGPHHASNAILYYRDITVERKLLSRLIQNEKVAAVGLLAGHLAHELNNPLTGIRSLSQIMLSEIPKGGNLHADLAEIENAARRSQLIIENLKSFSDVHHQHEKKVFDLSDVVQATLPLLRTALRHHRYHMLFDEGGLDVLAEYHLLQQVFFNLVNNACHAMGDGGDLTIKTFKEYRENEWWAICSVTDTGPGISAEVLPHIFEPFFTTKSEGEGTGLGLSLCRSIVKDFGGQLEVASRIGYGTSFFVRLPLLPAESKQDHHENLSR